MSKYYTDIVKLYSATFFNYALENNILKSITKELDIFRSILLENDDLIKAIADPIYSEQEQQELLAKTALSLELSDALKNLISLLIANKRASLLPEIINYYQFIHSEHQGNKIIEVTVSKELPLKEQTTLKEDLKKIFSSNLELNITIDPKILGGLIIKYDNKMLDSSLKSKFSHLIDTTKKKISLL